MNRTLIIHTASLYYCFDDYENHLDDRIHAALDAGFEGVEISNGPSILYWQPAPETTKRLRKLTVTLHAEFHDNLRLPELKNIVDRLPFDIANVVVHPDELNISELKELHSLPFPVSLENLDSRAPRWATEENLNRYMRGLGFCFDTAHSIENNISFSDFRFQPTEIHLSLPNSPVNHYESYGWQTRHSMTHFEPSNFPSVPSTCPIITAEGLAPPDLEILQDEFKFIKSMI